VPPVFYRDSASSSEESKNDTSVGISPPVLNLATKAQIKVNATCGENGPETYCKLVEHVYSRTRPSQCQVCDRYGLVRNVIDL